MLLYLCEWLTQIPQDPTGFARLMLNLTEASRTFAPCGSHRFNRLNKKTAGFVSLISHKLAQIFTNYFLLNLVGSVWALEIGALGALGAFGYAHDLSTKLREIYHHQKQNQWDLWDLCEPSPCPTTIPSTSVRFNIIKSKNQWAVSVWALAPYKVWGMRKKIAACGGAAIFALWVMCEFIFWGRRCFLRGFWFSIGHRLASCARLPPQPLGRWQQNARC